MPKILPKIPSIELPRYDDMASMVNSILQLKEAVELLSGQRGDKYFASREDISLTQSSIRSLQKSTPWDTIYYQPYGPVTGSLVVDKLSEYRMVRLAGYVRPTTDLAVNLQFSATGGTYIGAATDYSNDFMYLSSAAPTTVSANSIAQPWLPLSYTSAVQAANPYSCRFDIMFEQFNQVSQTTGHGNLDYYTGTSLIKGTYWLRPATGALAVSLDGFRLFCGSNASLGTHNGFLLVEGLKG